LKDAEKSKIQEIKQVEKEAVLKIETLKVKQADELREIEKESIVKIRKSSEVLPTVNKSDEVKMVIEGSSEQIEKAFDAPVLELSSEERKKLPSIVGKLSESEKSLLKELTKVEQVKFFKDKISLNSTSSTPDRTEDFVIVEKTLGSRRSKSVSWLSQFK